MKAHIFFLSTNRGPGSPSEMEGLLSRFSTRGAGPHSLKICFATPLRVAISGLLLGFCLGCGGGGSSETPPAEETSATPTAQPAKSSSSNNAASGTSSQQNTKSSDRKYVDGIPYDVFYDQPLTVASQNTAPAMTSNTVPASPMGSAPQNPAPAMNSTPAPQTTPPATATAENGSGDDWTNIITKERLLDEVMRLRNSLNANMNSVGNFNRELLKIQMDASVMAALAGVATRHPGEFTWKPNAKYVRDFSSTIATAAETRGRPAFEEAEKPFLNIIEILDGGTPGELPDSEDETVFSDVAERSKLMKQVGANKDWIQTTISSEGDMKNKKEELIARATVLGVIGSVIKQEDYVFADEAEYQGYCKQLIEGSLQAVKAAEADNFADFQASFELINKSCGDCHSTYLNN